MGEELPVGVLAWGRLGHRPAQIEAAVEVGLSEAITYSFVSPKDLAALGLPKRPFMSGSADNVDMTFADAQEIA